MGITTKPRKLFKCQRKFKVGTHYNVLQVENKTPLVLHELVKNFGLMRNIMTNIFLHFDHSCIQVFLYLAALFFYTNSLNAVLHWLCQYVQLI